MRFFHIAVLALTALLAPVSAGMIDASNAADEFLRDGEWKNFKLNYDKVYDTAAEEELRFQNFKDNMARSAELSKLNPEATFGVTRFSDLSQAEFKKQYLGYRPGSRPESMKPQACAGKLGGRPASPNANVDWRTSGAVTPVKDQGQCGSCWAFSAVEGVESAWFLKHNKTVVLSPQQVVSCDTYDGGCDGGDLPTAFRYIESAGLTTEAAYPYASGNSGATGACKKPSSTVAGMTNWTYATPACFGACTNQDEATLLTNVAATGPSSICVDAGNWQTYNSGVLSAGCSMAYGKLNHCVQLVGYQAASPSNYWIVRNSWGTSWGNKGYIYLKYGTNTCGVADEATFVVAN